MARTYHTGRFVFLAVVVVLFQFVFFRHFWMSQIGAALICQDAIVPADAILVLGGGSGERAQQGVALYHQKYAPRIIFTGENNHSLFAATFNWASAAQKLAVAGSVPKERTILILTSRSTHDDAVLSKEICLKNNFKSLIVVSEPYHARRAYFAFRKVYKNSGITFMMYPVQKSWYTKDNWWYNEEGFFDTVSEYTKFIYYLFKGYIV